jgi:RimJ/RimL family protein N-acetyltransferase
VRLREHDVILVGERIILRPLTEQDWPLLLRWNSDAQILYFSEGEAVEPYSLEQVQSIYRSVSQTAFCFIIEVNDEPIGECWLQQMNLARILEKYPEADCRRIDLMIGEKKYWGYGLGTEVIRLLSAFAFDQGAELVFGCDIADYNPASLKAFQKAGYVVVVANEQPPGAKARFRFDLLLARE